MEKLAFTLDDGTQAEFTIEDQTVVAGTSYLLVSDASGEEDTCYILKDMSTSDSEEAAYEFVEDEQELDAVFRIFQQIYDGEDTVLVSNESENE